jgi:methyl-accepting chemotaxis protein
VGRRLADLRFATKLAWFVGLGAVAFAVFAAASLQTLRTVVVNGPIYQEIVRSKDVVADVLPPPAYLVEVYAAAFQLLETQEADRRGMLVRHIAALAEDYEARHRFWAATLEPTKLRETLTGPAYRTGREVLRLVHAELIPAVERGDRARAQGLLNGALRQAFEAHRAAVDEVVRLARAAGQDAEARVARAVARHLWVLGLLGAGLLGLGVGAAAVLARSCVRPLAETVETLEAVAAGDFTRQLAVHRADEVGRVAAALNRAVETIRGTLLEVREVADQVAAASQQLRSMSERLAAGTQEQAASLEETAASLEEMTGTVRQTADHARQASQLALGAHEAAERGGQVVREAVDAMSEIHRAAGRVGAIIAAIDEIAFQTNLLALNAAVEAARAGEQGRSFAVVATEVRSLAQRSATAAREIKTLIEDSVGKAERGVVLANRSGQALDEIVAAVKRTADLIAEIAAAGQEEAAGIEQVNKAVGQMDRVVQAAAAQTEELASAAQLLAARADRLRGLVERFRASTEPATPWRGSTGPGPDAPASAAASRGRDGGRGRPAEARVGPVGRGGEGHPALDLVGDGSPARGRQA